MTETAAAEPPSSTIRRRRANTGLRLVGGAPIEASESPRGEFQPPRPLRAAASPLAAIPLPLVLWSLSVLPAPGAIGLGVCVGVLVAIRCSLSARDLRHSRSLGDTLLRAYPGKPPLSELAAWRATELITARSRDRAANLVPKLMRETEGRMRSSRTPSERGLLGENIVLLARIESRLRDGVSPVSPLGMLELHALVTSERSPNYVAERAGKLRAALARALSALDPGQ